ncbi:hypothetical protein scyTo_0017876 [Scyliorhinus torazame]|uniref:Uncharacterized protein n=1 Tax=Scyliorhinus torazame TaxID=75743 RepID=A0A401Q1P2_SCYTO|nr:hypothetical protein [Scyliorhinus torazame]
MKYPNSSYFAMRGVKTTFFMVQEKRYHIKIAEAVQQSTHVQKKSRNVQGEALNTNLFIPNYLKNCQKVNFHLTGARKVVGHMVEIKGF